MNKIYLAVLAGVALAGTTAFAQAGAKNTGTTSVAGQSIWRHGGPTSVTGQSIWRHEGLPGSSPQFGAARLPREAVRGGARKDGALLLLGIGPTCDTYYDPYVSAIATQERQDYYQPGYQWGAGLRENSLAWGDFVPYLEQYLLTASPNAQSAFRQGFAKGYGGNGEETYDHAFRQAARPG